MNIWQCLETFFLFSQLGWGAASILFIYSVELKMPRTASPQQRIFQSKVAMVQNLRNGAESALHRLLAPYRYLVDQHTHEIINALIRPKPWCVTLDFTFQRTFMKTNSVHPRDLLKNTVTFGSILRLGYLLPNLLYLPEMCERLQSSGKHQSPHSSKDAVILLILHWLFICWGT